MRRGVLLLAALSLAFNSQSLLDAVRRKVLDNAARVPRYTCVQTIERGQFEGSFRARTAVCDRHVSPGRLLWRDRLRLDVAVLDGRETFSWAGARQFETTDIDQLVTSGSSGSGDFASFLTGVFGLPETHISLAGTALFNFDVPADKSHYVYRSSATGERRVIGYHGSFAVDEAREELRRLTVEASPFPSEEQMCRVEDVMDYTQVKIGDGEFLLPNTSTMTVQFTNGQESRNETTYSGCREYVGETKIAFVDDDVPNAGTSTSGRAAPRKLPRGIRLQIGLQSRIDSRTAAAGDAVTGMILKDSGSARANDIVHGRILRLEQDVWPSRRWLVAIRFDSLEHDGAEQPLDLHAIDDGVREGRRVIVLDARPPGAGLYVFGGEQNLVLDAKFHSAWETR